MIRDPENALVPVIFRNGGSRDGAVVRYLEDELTFPVMGFPNLFDAGQTEFYELLGGGSLPGYLALYRGQVAPAAA